MAAIQAMHVALPDQEFETFKAKIEDELGFEIAIRAARRLFMLNTLFDTDNFEKTMDKKNPDNNCVLNFQTIELKQDAAYNDIIRMLTEDQASDQIWLAKKEKKLNVRGFIVCELLRQIGVIRVGRLQPPKNCRRIDSMLCTEFQFDRATMLRCCHRLRPRQA